VPLTYKDVAEVLRIIDASSVDELILELDGARLVVRRNGAAGGTAAPATLDPAPDPAPVAAPMAAPPQAPDDGRVAVRAPMVGTFYRRPSPAEPPFVEVGDRVAAGAAVGLIEVMKLFTTIEAPLAGRIAEVAVDSEAPVEYGQLLLLIDPE